MFAVICTIQSDEWKPVVAWKFRKPHFQHNLNLKVHSLAFSELSRVFLAVELRCFVVHTDPELTSLKSTTAQWL